jgi:uncharacterized protein YraI
MTLKQLRMALPLVLTTLVASFLALMPVMAEAATPAVVVTTVNLRAGPSTGYPIVTALPTRAAITVHGCTANSAWCDISWGGERGWIAANYVQIIYRGAPVVVTPAIAPIVGIGVVTFNQAYWHSYYVGRPWYGQWNTYYRAGPYFAPVGRAVVGSCGPNFCSGTVVTRGPYGGIYVRHGAISRY